MKLATYLQNKHAAVAVKYILVMIWLCNLCATNAYFSIYVICGAVAFLCLIRDPEAGHTLDLPMRRVVSVLSVLFSFAVVLSNYDILFAYSVDVEMSRTTNTLLNCLNASLTFLGGICVADTLLKRFYRKYFSAIVSPPRRTFSIHATHCFWGTFLLIAAIDLAYLFFVVYPGNLSGDAMGQINQVMSGIYKNDNPFWHTMTINLFVKAGLWLFGEINAAMAVYSVFQLLCMAFLFAYTVMTLCQYGVDKRWICGIIILYAFLPCHISYSVTMWKDVLFGGAILLLEVSLFRILKNIGQHPWLNYLTACIAGICVALWRTFGLALLAGCFVLWLLVFRKKHWKILAALGISLLVGWTLCNPVMRLLNVGQKSFVENFSIPIQQIARVIYDGKELTEEQTDLLEQIIDIDDIEDIYLNWISDPVKKAIKANNPDYLQKNMNSYVKLWIEIGLKYPGEYLKAWIDQTKGYWNAGYDYYIWGEFIRPNDYGIYMKSQSNPIYKLSKMYFSFARETIFFQPLQSIGFHLWILMALFAGKLAAKDMTGYLYLPTLIIIVGLWFTTPVFSEFRYAYSLFLTVPFALTEITVTITSPDHSG